MANRELLVRIVGDDRDLQRALGNTDRRLASLDSRTQTFGKNISRAFGAAGVTLGTAAVFAGIQRSVGAASDLNEQVSRTEVILGESAQESIQWSQTTASSFGISQRAALAANATFAGLFQTVGVGQEKAGELSRSLVQLAADLASLQNSSPEEALVALRSGLAGEAEPLRRFNIFLTETRVQQEALAQSGKRATSELTAQEKTLARYTLILRDSLPAQGNFSATSGELANQQRILRAQFDDLSANLGNVLVPVLTDAAEAANLLFLALNQMRGIDFSPGFDFPDPPDFLRAFALAPVSPLGATALGVKRLLDDDDKELKSVTEQIGSSVQNALGGLEDALGKRKEKLDKITAKESASQKKRFGEMLLGLGLKLDRARLTTTFSDDIAALRELEAAILRQIAREGKTFKLIQQLTNTRLVITALLEQQSAAATQAASDAFNDVMDALSLELEVAQTTRSLQDDQQALRAIEQALLDRIAKEGRTTELLRELLRVRQQQADAARQLAEQKREQRQGKQFEAIGLTDEGEERTPGAGALRRRTATLEEQIKGTTLDTDKTRATLDRIKAVLAGKFGEVGREVRQAILQMLNDISSALKQGTEDVERTSGEITRGGIRSTQKLLKGLGLTPEQAAELQRRNLGVAPGSHASAFGFGIGGSAGSSSNIVTSGPREGRPGSGIFIQNLTVVTNDPNDMMKKLQKKARRSSGGRRGRHGGANLGMQ